MIDVGKFFKNNWKFLLLLTLMLAVVAVILTSLLGRQFTKQISLSVTPTTTDLMARLELSPLTSAEAGPLAVSYLQGADLSPIDASSRYEPVSQRVEVTLQSENRGALEEAASRVIRPINDGFRELYEKNLGNALNTQLAQTEAQVENDARVISRLDREIEQAIPADPQGDDVALARIEALESERASAIAELVPQEARSERLERAEGDLPRLADEVVSVDVISESRVSESGSLAGKVAYAIAGSFLVALLATVVRAFFSRGK